MPSTEIDFDSLSAIADGLPEGSPVFMINLLQFHPRAAYASDADVDPCSGREAYLTRYMPAFNEVAEQYGASEMVYAGDVIGRVVGPVGEFWDAVGLVRYPTIDAFQKVALDPTYLRTAQPHRLAALADWRLFASTSLA